MKQIKKSNSQKILIGTITIMILLMTTMVAAEIKEDAKMTGYHSPLYTTMITTANSSSPGINLANDLVLNTGKNIRLTSGNLIMGLNSVVINNLGQWSGQVIPTDKGGLGFNPLDECAEGEVLTWGFLEDYPEGIGENEKPEWFCKEPETGDGSTTIISGNASLWNESSGNVYRPTGRVGIGINNPSYDLHIRGPNEAGGSITQLNLESSAIGNLLTLHSPNNDVYSARISWEGVIDGLLLGKGYSDPQMFFDSVNKRVGIGTYNPSAKLHVVSSTDTSSLILTSQNSANLIMQSPLGSSGGVGVSNDYGLIRTSTGQLRLGAVGGTHITINTDGNIGIGTNKPQKKLHVTGDIMAQGSYFVGNTKGLTKQNIELTDNCNMTVTGGLVTSVNCDYGLISPEPPCVPLTCSQKDQLASLNDGYNCGEDLFSGCPGVLVDCISCDSGEICSPPISDFLGLDTGTEGLTKGMCQADTGCNPTLDVSGGIGADRARAFCIKEGLSYSNIDVCVNEAVLSSDLITVNFPEGNCDIDGSSCSSYFSPPPWSYVNGGPYFKVSFDSSTAGDYYMINETLVPVSYNCPVPPPEQTKPVGGGSIEACYCTPGSPDVICDQCSLITTEIDCGTLIGCVWE
jgi:hypothetical protein